MNTFDYTQIDRQRTRAKPRFHDHDFLFQATADQIIDRLDDIKRRFENVLIIGPRGADVLIPRLKKIGKITVAPTIISLDHETLPRLKGPYDLVLSVLELHTINDLPGMFAQIQMQLKPDGVLCTALFGGETLYELRDCLQQAELSLRNGVSPRIFPFADKPQIGALLQRTKFALPVIDSDIVRVDYPHLTRLLHDLRGMGEGNAIAARDKRFVPRDLFNLTEKIYREKYPAPNGRITATFEIIHLIGWAPAPTQPQPLQPGSAKTRLADVL